MQRSFPAPGKRGSQAQAGCGRSDAGVSEWPRVQGGLKQAGGRLVQRETPFLALGLRAIHSYVLAVKSLKNLFFFFLSLFRKVLGWVSQEGGLLRTRPLFGVTISRAANEPPPAQGSATFICKFRVNTFFVFFPR